MAITTSPVTAVAALRAVPYIERTGWHGQLVALVIDEKYRGQGGEGSA